MILLLSTSDTDLITAAASGAELRGANPSRILVDDIDELAAGTDLIVVRILGVSGRGRTAWPRSRQQENHWWCARVNSSPIPT